MVQAVRRSVHIIGLLQTCSKTNGDCANFYCHIGQVDLRSVCCCPTAYEQNHGNRWVRDPPATDDDKIMVMIVIMMMQFNSLLFMCRVKSYKNNYRHGAV
jgi:hypothetical protein